jgi:integrase
MFSDFSVVPARLCATMKAIVYRYLRRGREGKKAPSHRSVMKLLADARPFLQHVDRLGIGRLADVTPMVCALYVDACKQHRQPGYSARPGAPLKGSSLSHRLAVVEALYELSQHTDDAMPSHPWPGTSFTHLAGKSGPGTGHRGGTTPLMPDEDFTALFQHAWAAIERGNWLLDLRDGIDDIARRGDSTSRSIRAAQSRYLKEQGWSEGWRAFAKAVLELRAACYIAVASVSGCRNHELAFVQSGACYSMPVDTVAPSHGPSTEVYWWMRSQSTKTGEGHTEWMVPEAAVKALRLIERWARPYQAAIEAEIAARRAADPFDPEVAEAQRHARAVFLASLPLKGNQVRTLSAQMCNLSLKAFARMRGLTWDLASHQFRRKFANYAARSQFGDLRYLREHFKHWSLDMTLGYALNESQEIALYGEIENELRGIKTEVVDTWLRPGERLAGGYGRNIMAWRGTEPVTLFKSHAQMVRALSESTGIRSNGHAWCTAEDNQCVGNDIEPTRCTDCNHAVIGRRHAPLYRGLYDHLREVIGREDIGDGGRALVQRDLQRCRRVLVALGQDPEGT